MNEKFVASVQHGDFKGSSAADEQDVIGISSWLKKNKHIRDNETLVGVQMISGGNHREHRFPAGVIFLVVNLDNNQTVPDLINSSENGIPVRKISIDMDIADFFALFKSFEVTLSPKGIFEGMDYMAL